MSVALPRPRRRFAGRPKASTLSAGLVAAAVLVEPTVFGQTFRSAVDLIAVDVHVTDGRGRTPTTLAPEDFEVTLDGRRRRVVSATLTQHGVTPLPATSRRLGLSQPDASDAVVAMPAADGGGRTFILSLDTASFRALDIRPAVTAAQRFVRQIGPTDRVGVFTLPYGPQVEPTDNHSFILQVLSSISGRKPPIRDASLNVEQVIDITAMTATLSQFATRRAISEMFDEESVTGDQITCGGNTVLCTEAVLLEAEGLAHLYEEEVQQGVESLESLLRLLQGEPGRKTVILLSGGMPVSDRSSGRPRLSNQVRNLGELATYANATIHTLYFDQDIDASFASESRKPRAATARTRGIYTRALIEFTEPSGGTLTEVSTGAGENEIDRLLVDLSSYYVLGVEPDDRDRDGRPHRLNVKVATRDVDIRSRRLVLVPRAASR